MHGRVGREVGEREGRKKMPGYGGEDTSRGTEGGKRRDSYFDRGIRESFFKEVVIEVRPERSREESRLDIWGK